MTGVEDTQPMSGYLWQFALIFTALSVVIGLALYALEIDGNAGASVGVAIASAIFVAQRFFVANKRIMNTSERRRAILGSLVISVVVSAALMVLLTALMAGSLKGGLSMLRSIFDASLPLPMWFLAGAIGLALQGAILWFSYGYLARRIAQKKPGLMWSLRYQQGSARRKHWLARAVNVAVP